jgi:hypothetical protein
MAVSDSTPIGARFEKLSVISGPTKNKYGIAQVHCRCECGAEKTVNCADLRDGKIKSCGCWRKDIGKRSIAQSLIDGKYRGITANDQQVNNKQSSHFFEFFGEIMTVSQWAARTGIAVNTLYSRIKNGWSEDRVLTPVKR